MVKNYLSQHYCLCCDANHVDKQLCAPLGNFTLLDGDKKNDAHPCHELYNNTYVYVYVFREMIKPFSYRKTKNEEEDRTTGVVLANLFAICSRIYMKKRTIRRRGTWNNSATLCIS